MAAVLPPDVSVVLTLDASLNVEGLTVESGGVQLTSVSEPLLLVLTIG
jgi:hypothetical protein